MSFLTPTSLAPATRSPVMPVTSAQEPDSNHEAEMAALVDALSVKFEELTLIHQLTEFMQLDAVAEETCQALVDQMFLCVGAEAVVIDLDGDEESNVPGATIAASQSEMILPDWMPQIIEQLDRASESDPVVIENDVVSDYGTRFRLVGISIARSGTQLGRLYAVRNFAQPEFGTVEADLMKSSAMLLGVHLVNQRQFNQMQVMFEGTIRSLVSALDAKDAYTSGHSSRVADLAAELGRRLGFDEDDLSRIHMAGMLHDIGKIGVDDAVLRKPGRLTPEEFEEIKKHPVLGYEILRGIPSFKGILPAVRHHHESVDGSGYPDGLVGDDIPRDAQVLAVADAFDAMTSDRPYREGLPIEKVVSIFSQGRGQQWAADVVDVLLRAPDVMHAYSLKDSEIVAGRVKQ